MCCCIRLCGQETLAQLEQAGGILTLWWAVQVVVVISLALPFLHGCQPAGEQEHLKFVAVEPAACPTLTKGKYTYDFGIQRISPLW